MLQATRNLLQLRNTATGRSIDKEEYRSTHINDAIAASDRFTACARADSDGTKEDPLSSMVVQYTNLTSIMLWFRDQKGVQTVGEMFDLIENRQVPLKVVELWVEEFFKDAMPSCKLQTVIFNSYPEFRMRMDRHMKQRIAKSFRNVALALESI